MIANLEEMEGESNKVSSTITRSVSIYLWNVLSIFLIIFRLNQQKQHDHNSSFSFINLSYLLLDVLTSHQEPQMVILSKVNNVLHMDTAVAIHMDTAVAIRMDTAVAIHMDTVVAIHMDTAVAIHMDTAVAIRLDMVDQVVCLMVCPLYLI